MPIVKNTIAASVKRNTHRGYIGWSSCDNICMDMHGCLDICAEALELCAYTPVLEAAAYILTSGVKLASHADSSSGMLTDVIMCTYGLIDKCTKKIAKQDERVRDEMRIMAIKDAIEEKDYDEAEKLCLEKANAEETWRYRSSDPEDWNNMLYDIYKAAGNTEKQMIQAKKLLFMGNGKFWDVLKQIYIDCGTWNENYESLLDELKASKRNVCYRSVLVAENEKKRLLEDVMENPYDLFYYGECLVEDYPEQIYELCYKVISDNCAGAKDRREYKKITKQIEQLMKWNGNETARSLIEELKKTYPRRTAFLDELEKVEKKFNGTANNRTAEAEDITAFRRV